MTEVTAAGWSFTFAEMAEMAEIGSGGRLLSGVPTGL
jgi:hypothetical protein